MGLRIYGPKLLGMISIPVPVHERPKSFPLTPVSNSQENLYRMDIDLDIKVEESYLHPEGILATWTWRFLEGSLLSCRL